MDVVRTNIEKIGGNVELKSVTGKGSTFTIKIPLTLAIVSALIVESAKERFAIPQISVLAPDLQPWLSFHPAAVVNDGERPMQVDVPVRNLSDQLYLIDYRILFYDDNGLQLEPGMGWRMEALRAKQTGRLRARALSSDADSYRLEVKWAG